MKPMRTMKIMKGLLTWGLLMAATHIITTKGICENSVI